MREGTHLQKKAIPPFSSRRRALLSSLVYCRIYIYVKESNQTTHPLLPERSSRCIFCFYRQGGGRGGGGGGAGGAGAGGGA